jgi:hypothetical protein
MRRSLRRKAQAMVEAMQELTKTKLRLGRLHGVHDGSFYANWDNLRALHGDDDDFDVDEVEWDEDEIQ